MGVINLIKNTSNEIILSTYIKCKVYNESLLPAVMYNCERRKWTHFKASVLNREKFTGKGKAQDKRKWQKQVNMDQRADKDKR